MPAMASAPVALSLPAIGTVIVAASAPVALSALPRAMLGVASAPVAASAAVIVAVSVALSTPAALSASLTLVGPPVATMVRTLGWSRGIKGGCRKTPIIRLPAGR